MPPEHPAGEAAGGSPDPGWTVRQASPQRSPHQTSPPATTGLPGLDAVLLGIRPGDNIVWSVERIEDYIRLVGPYERAARQAGRRVVYFRFAPHAPLFTEQDPVEIHRVLDFGTD